MDWGNAIITSKSTSPSSVLTSLTATLNLAGDFRKTDKKITWLADPASTHRPLVNVTLLDYDYLITKKKLEDEDRLEDFVTPKTEFRVEAWADGNVAGLKEGEIVQFERKGYYRVDKVTGNGEGLHVDFVRIPDGKAAGLASKNVPTEKEEGKGGKGGSGKKGEDKKGKGKDVGDNPAKEKGGKKEKKGGEKEKSSAGGAPADGERIVKSNATSGFGIPVTTKMYETARVYGEEALDPKADTKMYKVGSVYGEV